MRYPIPHVNYMPIKPLSDELYNGLLSIYENAKTYKTTFEVSAFQGTTMTWPETDEEQQWIIDKVLPYYNLSVDDVYSLEYMQKDMYDDRKGKRSDGNHRRDWGFKNVPERMPNTLNFTTVREHSLIEAHNDHEADCKINVPIKNMSAANIYFKDSDEAFYYNTPVLIHCASWHEVQHIDRMKKFNIPERTFFQIVLKKSFVHYQNVLPWPNGY